MSALTEDQLDALWELGQMAFRAEVRRQFAREALASACAAPIYVSQRPYYIEAYINVRARDVMGRHNEPLA